MSRLFHTILWPMVVVTHLMRMQYMHSMSEIDLSEIDSDVIHMTLIDRYMNNANLIQVFYSVEVRHCSYSSFQL